MYHVSAQGIDERMINVHYYYYCSIDRKLVGKSCFAYKYKQESSEIN